MKFFKEEFVYDYETYKFGYTTWAIKEENDPLYSLYEKGFLPYSGESGVQNKMYMARSVRVDLTLFEPTSENRRILKKFDTPFTRAVKPIDQFDIFDSKFIDFCTRYFKEVHEIDATDKINTVLSAGFITDIVIYTDTDNKVIGYVFLAQDEKMMHYWFSFYDVLFQKRSLGMWMMLQEIIEAHKSGKKFAYLGTGYGEKSKYKQNFQPLEYWDGNEWHSDKQTLKELGKTDTNRHI